MTDIIIIRQILKLITKLLEFNSIIDPPPTHLLVTHLSVNIKNSTHLDWAWMSNPMQHPPQINTDIKSDAAIHPSAFPQRVIPWLLLCYKASIIRTEDGKGRRNRRKRAAIIDCGDKEGLLEWSEGVAVVHYIVVREADEDNWLAKWMSFYHSPPFHCRVSFTQAALGLHVLVDC